MSFFFMFMYFFFGIMILILVSLNYSFYFFCFFFNFNFIFFVSYIGVWFNVFMYFVFYYVFYLLSKKMYSLLKYLFVMCCFMYMFLLVICITYLDDFVLFVCFFEAIFFPMCFGSFVFSYSNSFMFSVYYLIFYSSFSSIFFMILLLVNLFHFNMFYVVFFYDICFFDNFSLFLLLWFCMFLVFGVKYPIWPLHVWLPELHVEVTTEMSMLLAAMVLKIGFFGFLRFVFLSFNFMSIWFVSILNIFCMFGLFCLNVNIMFLCDYKKIIAFWSIVHTSFGILLLWNNDYLYLSLYLLCNVSHIISSSLMFSLLGVMYDNYGMRLFLVLVSFFGVSLWSYFFVVIVLFNVDFPFMLLFYVDLIFMHGIMFLSYIMFFFFMMVNVIAFCSSFYVYLNMICFSFLWYNFFLRLDIVLNDVFYVCFMFFFTFFLYFYLHYFF